MTDHTAATCAACETPLQGRYCHVCGQDRTAKPAPLKEMVVQVATSYSPIDGKLARTFAVLATRPGRLLDAYRNGAGSLYVTPLKLFVAATALFLSVLNFSNTTLYQYVWKVTGPDAAVRAVYDPANFDVSIVGAEEQDRWLQPRIEPAIDPQIVRVLEDRARTAPMSEERAAMTYELVANEEEARVSARLSDWLPNVLWLLMPLYAVALMPLFGLRRLFLEHVIFAMWAHAVAFLLAMGVAGLNSRGLNLSGAIVLPPYLAYFTVAAARYYNVSLLQAFWRSLLHTAFYVLLVLVPAAVIIYATVMDWGAFWAWYHA
jgi:hypothetical protein